MEDFIRVYDNAFSNKFCDDVIETFDWADESGFTLSRQHREDGISKTKKNDKSIYACEFDLKHAKHSLGDGFSEVFWNSIYPKYSGEFSESLVDASAEYAIYSMKVQKTLKGQGYHQWHYEASGREVGNRLLAWAVYLNDVEEGGETEFLYQHKRVKPTKGSLVMFPGSFTHLHRGNPPLSGSKYIITGWVEF
jgi:hypothetical protein